MCARAHTYIGTRTYTHKYEHMYARTHARTCTKVILFPLVPVSEDPEDRDDEYLADFRRLIVPVLRTNYKPEAQRQAAENIFDYSVRQYLTCIYNMY